MKEKFKKFIKYISSTYKEEKPKKYKLYLTHFAMPIVLTLYNSIIVIKNPSFLIVRPRILSSTTVTEISFAIFSLAINVFILLVLIQSILIYLEYKKVKEV